MKLVDCYHRPGPMLYSPRISKSLKEASRLMVRCRITKWKLTASQLDDLLMVTGQNQLLLGVPVVKSVSLDMSQTEPYDYPYSDTVVRLFLAEIVTLYLSDEDMEVDELERLVDVAIRGGVPKHSGLPWYRSHYRLAGGGYCGDPDEAY